VGSGMIDIATATPSVSTLVMMTSQRRRAMTLR
jgi:hypothetical protein